MIKQVKSVKVVWNDETGRAPRFSFFKDEKSALEAVEAFCGRDSAWRVWMQPVTRLLNTENREDMKFYNLHAGKTCVDALLSGEGSPTPEARNVIHVARQAQRPYFAKVVPVKQAEFAFVADPKRVAAGTSGGAANLGVSKTKTQHARPGSVMVSKMDQMTKRSYWRCMSLRARQRKAGVPMTSWASYRIDHPVKKA